MMDGAAEKDVDFSKLPPEELVHHKNWKARIQGYEVIKNAFETASSGKDPVFLKYADFIKSMVSETNVAALEKALETVAAFLDNANIAPKTAGEACPLLVTKCLGNAKAKISTKAQELLLMYIELEKSDVATAALNDGLQNKNPKVLSAALITVTSAVQQFGDKVVNVKPMLKHIVTLLENRDRDVRKNVKALLVEIYRWLGPALKLQLQGIQPIQLTELESEFSSIKGKAPLPTRLTKSQQQRAVAAGGDSAKSLPQVDSEVDVSEEVPQVAADPWESMQPVDVVSKLPENFYEQLDAKKWLERKEMLEILLKLLADNPRLDQGAHYGDVVAVLKKIISKDSNINVVAVAAKCMAGIASGLRKKFAPFATSCVPVVLLKFKEKKAVVVAALIEAIDAVGKTTSLDAIFDDLVEALGSKNPSVKVNTCLFLSRHFEAIPAAASKKTLKNLVPHLIKLMVESDPEVREAAAQCIGTAMRIVGEKALMPFLAEIKDDHLKINKIKECAANSAASTAPSASSKSQLTAEQQTASKPPQPQATSSRSAPKEPKPTASAEEAQRPAPPSEGRQVARRENPKPPLPTAEERELTDDDVDELLTGVFQEELLQAYNGSLWKDRLAAVEQMNKIIRSAKPSDVPVQAVVRLLVRKKENNFQIQKLKIDLISYVAKNCKFSQTSFDCCLADTIAKLSDPKLNESVHECLGCLVAAIGFSNVAQAVLAAAFEQKSPKVQAEIFTWTSNTIKSLPETVSMPPLKQFISKGLAASSPVVRLAAADLQSSFDLKNDQAEATAQVSTEKPKQNFQSEDGNRPKQRVSPEVNGNVSSDEITTESTGHSSNDGSSNASKAVHGNRTSVATGASPPKATPITAKEAEEQDELIPCDASAKHARFHDEKALKLLKWQFATPTAEHVEQLKNQLKACCKPLLFMMLFHADFKQHLKALDLMTQSLQRLPQFSLNISDLLLKWCTLRFFDTNPSVLMKCMEYLMTFTNTMAAAGCELHDLEAASFLPYFLLKLGDPKDHIRQAVQDIMAKICQLHPPTKIFGYVLEACKTKNSRQKAECLQLISFLIQNYGMSVCGQPLQTSLRSVAQNIADRDKNVRNAALNALLTAYSFVGQRIFKLVSPINSKEMSMLEERIKRCGKIAVRTSKPPEPANVAATPTAVPPAETVTPAKPAATSTPVATPQPVSACSTLAQNRVLLDRNENLVDISSPQTNGMKKRPPRFSFNFEKLGIDLNERYKIARPVLTVPDGVDDLLNTEIPSFLLPDNFVPLQNTSTNSSNTSNSNSNDHASLNSALQDLKSIDVNTALAAVLKIDSALKDPMKRDELTGNVDSLIASICSQLSIVHEKYLSDENQNFDDLENLCKNLLLVLMSLFSLETLANEVTENPLRCLMSELLTLMIEKKLERVANCSVIQRALNVMASNVIEHSNETACGVALLRLLKSSLKDSSRSDTFRELTMKCLWRWSRLLPSAMESLKVTPILTEADEFFIQYPSSYWTTQPSDLPLRTVKTVIHIIVKSLRNKIFDYVYFISNPQSNALFMFIQKTLRALSKEDSKSATAGPVCATTSSTSSSLQTSTSDMEQPVEKLHTLRAIFKKIGIKATSEEGLKELYDFTLKYPEYSIMSFLQKSAPFFQEFIMKGLEDIRAKDRQRRPDSYHSHSERAPTSASSSISGSIVRGHLTAESISSPLAKPYLERLLAMSNDHAHSDVPRVYSHDQLSDIEQSLDGGSSSLTSSHGAASCPNMGDYQKRLEEIQKGL